MKKLVLVPNNMKSRGAKALAETLSHQLGYKVYRVAAHRVRNRKAFVLHGGTDKLTQLKSFNSNEVDCPENTTDINIARAWIGDGSSVMCRRLLRASEGRGIVVAETVDQLVNAPLYTKYVPKKEEYRVHVFDGEVIGVQQKKKRRGFEDERNTKIRNLANGYVFCHSIPSGIPDGLEALALNSARMVSSDFAGVDLIYNEHQQQLYVIEVNSAPGISGSNVDSYVQHILGEVA